MNPAPRVPVRGQVDDERRRAPVASPPTVARAGLTYLGAALLSRGVVFVLLPFVTRRLSDTELGTLAIATTVAALVGALATLGVPAAVALWFPVEPRHRGDRRAADWAGLVVAQAVAAMGLAGALWLAGPYWSRLFADVAWGTELELGLALGVALSWVSIMQSVFRAARRPTAFAAVAAVQAGISVPLALAGATRWGPSGYLVGFIAGAVVAAVGAAAFALPAPRLKKATILAGAAVSLPVAVHAVATWMLSMSDRIVLERIEGIDAVGVYFVAYSVGSATLLVVQSIHGAWAANYLSNAEPSATDHITLVRRAADAVLVLYLTTLALTPVALRVVAPEVDADMLVVCALVGLSALVLVPYIFSTTRLLRSGRTLALAPATLLAAALNIGLNLVLVPAWGMRGAAAATVASFAFQAALTAGAARRVSGIRMPMLVPARPLAVGLGATALFVVAADRGGSWMSVTALVAGLTAVVAATGVWRRHRRRSELVVFTAGSTNQRMNAEAVAAHLRVPTSIIDIRSGGSLDDGAGPAEPVGYIRSVWRTSRLLVRHGPTALVVPHDIGLLERAAIAQARRIGTDVVLMPDGFASSAPVPLAGDDGARGLVHRALETTGVVAGRRTRWASSGPDLILSWGVGWHGLFGVAAPTAVLRAVGSPRADDLVRMPRVEQPDKLLVCSQPLWTMGIATGEQRRWYRRLVDLSVHPNVRVRLHPDELGSPAVPDVLRTKPRRSFEDDLAWAAAVAAPASTVLVEALAAGRHAIVVELDDEQARRTVSGIPVLAAAEQPRVSLSDLADLATMRSRGLFPRRPRRTHEEYLVNIGHAAPAAARALHDWLGIADPGPDVEPDLAASLAGSVVGVSIDVPIAGAAAARSTPVRAETP